MGSQHSHGAAPGRSTPRNGAGVASLVFGVIALLSSWFVVGIVFGVFAVVFGFTAEALVMRGDANNRGMAIVGMVLGVVAMVVGLAALALSIWCHA